MKKYGVILQITTALMAITVGIILIFFAPNLLDLLLQEEKFLFTPSMVIICASAVPVIGALVVLFFIGHKINCDDCIEKSYARLFCRVGQFAIFDVALYLVLDIIFCIFYNPILLALCLAVQLAGAGMAGIAFACSAIMRRASEIKAENDLTI